MDDRWIQLPGGGYIHLPPLPACPNCGNDWYTDHAFSPKRLSCDCTPAHPHSGVSCDRCHAVLAEGCTDPAKLSATYVRADAVRYAITPDGQLISAPAVSTNLGW